MKNVLIIAISALTLASCSSKKAVIDEETLPKDIALKPNNNFTQEDEQRDLKNLIVEIETQISAETCTDPTEWKFAAIGSKPCGGPSSYLAYPLKLENEILPKITHFTSMQNAFNIKYNLTSDCAMVLPPVEIRCEDGKAVLIGGSIRE